MRTIWKYELNPGRNNIELPAEFIALSVQIQNNTPCLWCLVETENILVNRFFYVFSTGGHIDSELNLKFIGTFQSTWMVFHLFEEVL